MTQNNTILKFKRTFLTFTGGKIQHSSFFFFRYFNQTVVCLVFNFMFKILFNWISVTRDKNNEWKHVFLTRTLNEPNHQRLRGIELCWYLPKYYEEPEGKRTSYC